MSRRSGFKTGLLAVADLGGGGGGEPEPDDLVILDVETFQTDFGVWNTPGVDDPEDAWLRTDGPTPTGSTGPNGGSNPADRAIDAANTYAFTESSILSNSPWSLESAQLDVSAIPSLLTFDVFMRFGSLGGVSDGTLIVQGWNGSAWSQVGPTITGSQQTAATDAWEASSTFGVYSSIAFTNTDFKWRFLATRGGDVNQSNYDFAVDNVVILGGLDTLTPIIPPANTRALAFNTGLRRLHVSKGGAAPLDGTTPDLSFSTIQAALNVMVQGDVITVGDGEYRERPSVSNRSGTVAQPIWIAAENPGAVFITDYWTEARDGTAVWTLVNGATDRYRSPHGDSYMAVHNGRFHPRYSSTANLDAASVNGVNRPAEGIAFAGGNIHIRLRGGVNPNGENIFIPETSGRNVVQFNNCDNIIFDGFDCEGGGEQSGIGFDTASNNAVVANCRSDTSRFLCRVPSNSIVSDFEYTLAGDGGRLWMRECVSLNGGDRAAFFDLIKGDLAQGGNAVYEGGVAVGAGGFQVGAVHTNCEFKRGRTNGVFDGARFGEFRNSEMFECVFNECGDDGIQFEDDRNSNDGDNNRAYFNRFVNPHGPVFSHQLSSNATNDVMRNIVEITEPAIFAPVNFIKTNGTQAGADVRYAHNYFEHFGTSGTRNVWTPFASTGAGPSGGQFIDLFINSIVVMPGGVSSNSGGVPSVIGDNLVAGPASTNIYLGSGGVDAGAVKADVEVNSDFTLQSTSPARNIGRVLPGGLVDPISDPDANDDAGPFPFGFEPGANWPRVNAVAYNTQQIPDRWTSPGN